jgi:hypothetical protein
MKTFGHAGMEPTNTALCNQALLITIVVASQNLHPGTPASPVDHQPTQMPCAASPTECGKGITGFKMTPSRGEATIERRRHPIPQGRI